MRYLLVCLLIGSTLLTACRSTQEESIPEPEPIATSSIIIEETPIEPPTSSPESVTPIPELASSSTIKDPSPIEPDQVADQVADVEILAEDQLSATDVVATEENNVLPEEIDRNNYIVEEIGDIDHLAAQENPGPEPVFENDLLEQDDLVEVFYTLTGWGEGSSGSTLKTFDAVEELLEYANDVSAAQIDSGVLASSMLTALSSLRATDFENVATNLETVRTTGNDLFTNSVPIGLDPDIAEELNAPNAQENWNAVWTAIDSAITLV